MKVTLREHPRLKTEMEITFDPDSWGRFLEGIRGRLLQSEFADQEHVLRAAAEHPLYGGDWTVFFRIREGEAKIMMAHPDPKSWVATLLLPRKQFEMWSDAPLVEGVWESQSVRPAYHMNNLSVRLVVLN